MNFKLLIAISGISTLLACGGGGGGGSSAPEASPETTSAPLTSVAPTTGSAGSSGTNSSTTGTSPDVSQSTASDSSSSTSTSTASTAVTISGPAAETTEVQDQPISGTAALVVNPAFDFRLDREVELIFNKPVGTRGAVHVYRNRDEAESLDSVTYDPFSRISTALSTSDILIIDVGGAWDELILHYVPEDGLSPDSMIALGINDSETVYTIAF